MKILAVVFAAALMSGSLFAQDVKKGDRATVPNWKWVEVKNLNPVRNGNTAYTYGDSCGIRRGGIVTVIGIDGIRLLVHYTLAGPSAGTECPGETIFFVEKETFSKMTAEYRRIVQAEKSEKSIVERLSK